MSEEELLHAIHDDVPASCVGHIYTIARHFDVNSRRKSYRSTFITPTACYTFEMHIVQAKTVEQSCRAIYTTFTKVTQVLHHT